MIVKNKTCITIIKLINNGEFTDNIHIPHNVNLIRITSIGSVILLNNVLDNSAYYVVSNLVSNMHDNILGVFGNLNYAYNSSKTKEFLTKNVTINGTYTFRIYETGTIDQLNQNYVGPVHIDIEFIEYDEINNQSNNKKSIYYIDG